MTIDKLVEDFNPDGDVLDWHILHEILGFKGAPNISHLINDRNHTDS